MRRSGIEPRLDDPARRVRKRVEGNWNNRERECELICRLLEGHVVQPHDMCLAVRKLGVVVVMGCKVPVRYRVGMVVVRFVNMLRRGDG